MKKTAPTTTIMWMDRKDSTRGSYYIIKIIALASSNKTQVSIFLCKGCCLKIPQAILVNNNRIKSLICSCQVQGSSSVSKRICSWIEEAVQWRTTTSQIHSLIIKELKMEWHPVQIFLIKPLWWQLCLQISTLPPLTQANSTLRSLHSAQVCGWRPIHQTLRSS